MTGQLVLPDGTFKPDAFTELGYLQFGNDASEVGLCSKGYIASGGSFVVLWPKETPSGGVYTFALTAPNPTAGHIATLDEHGNLVDSGKSLQDIQDQIDTESPLLARSFAVPQQ